MSLPKRSASAECHNLTFGPSLQCGPLNFATTVTVEYMFWSGMVLSYDSWHSSWVCLVVIPHPKRILDFLHFCQCMISIMLLPQKKVGGALAPLALYSTSLQWFYRENCTGITFEFRLLLSAEVIKALRSLVNSVLSKDPRWPETEVTKDRSVRNSHYSQGQISRKKREEICQKDDTTDCVTSLCELHHFHGDMHCTLVHAYTSD